MTEPSRSSSAAPPPPTRLPGLNHKDQRLLGEAQPSATPGGSFPFLGRGRETLKGAAKRKSHALSTHNEETQGRVFSDYSPFTPSLSKSLQTLSSSGLSLHPRLPCAVGGRGGLAGCFSHKPTPATTRITFPVKSSCYTRHREWMYTRKVLRDRAGRGVGNQNTGRAVSPLPDCWRSLEGTALQATGIKGRRVGGWMHGGQTEELGRKPRALPELSVTGERNWVQASLSKKESVVLYTWSIQWGGTTIRRGCRDSSNVILSSLSSPWLILHLCVDLFFLPAHGPCYQGRSQ